MRLNIYYDGRLLIFMRVPNLHSVKIVDLIDIMSSSFDTITIHKLIDVCKTFLEQDKVKLIRLFLSDTSLNIT